MYKAAPIAADQVDVEQLYINKLRISMNEMIVAKEEAIRMENYGLADQLRIKLTSLQLQLIKSEHQFNADLLTNFVTVWQDGIIQFISKSLYYKEKTGKPPYISSSFPSKEPFQCNFVESIGCFPTKYYDSFIRSICLIIPVDSPDNFVKSPFGFEFFIRKLGTLTKNQENLDLVRFITTLCCFDILLRITGNINETSVDINTLEILLKHCQNYIKFFKRGTSDIERMLFEKISTRLSIIVGDLALIDRSMVIKHIYSLVDHNKKSTSEEMLLVLSTTRYISSKPVTSNDFNELLYLINELCLHFEKNKKTIIRISIILSLERIIQPIDLTSFFPRESYEIALVNEISEIAKKARKWMKDDDLKACCTRLLGIILINSKSDYFGQNYDSYINNDLFPKSKIKSFAYECALQILRGQYYLETLNNSRNRVTGNFSISDSYSYLTRPRIEEVREATDNRIRDLSEKLFVRRKGPIGLENLNTCVQIVVQMAAQSFPLTLRLISHLLESKNSDTNIRFEENFIGVHVLYIIINKSSKFCPMGYSVDDANYKDLLASTMREYEVYLPKIFLSCEPIVGIATLGKSTAVLEKTQFKLEEALEWKNNRNASDKSKSNKDSVNLFEDDIFNAISEAIDHANTGSNPNIAEKDTPVNPVVDSYSYGTHSRMASEDERLDNVTTEFESTDELNRKVSSSIKIWHEMCNKADNTILNVERVVDSLKVSLPQSKRKSPRITKPEVELVVKLMKELIKLIPFMPLPELTGKKFLIGSYLIHSIVDISHQVAITLQTIFAKHSMQRLEIINGFLNFLKFSQVNDDISICTTLTQLSHLLYLWSKKEIPPLYDTERDAFYRSSCKIDAAMMLMFARPNSQIRKLAIKILADYNSIVEQIFPLSHPLQPGQFPLFHILATEVDISRWALYAYLEDNFQGNCLEPSISSSLPLLSFADVAASDYAGLFKFYLGELVRQFAAAGRSKALRHCVKWLKHIAIPELTSTTNFTPDVYSAYSAYLVLLFGLAGVPEKSETHYTIRAVASPENLLLSTFRGYVPSVLNSENEAEIKAVTSASYFLHRSVFQLLISNLLQWYNDSKKTKMSHRLMDNLLLLLRFSAQSPEFRSVIREPPLFVSSLIDILSEFLLLAENALNDVSFLQTGPVFRLQSAINYCVINQRLAESLSSSESLYSIQRLSEDYEKNEPDSKVEVSRFVSILSMGGILNALDNVQNTGVKLNWKVSFRRACLFRFKEWYSIALEVSSVMSSNENINMNQSRYKLMRIIGFAIEKVLSVPGNIFENSPIPQDLIVWLTKMESSGYSGPTQSKSLIFTQAIFDQIISRRVEGPELFLSGEDVTIPNSAKDYISTLHGLPYEDGLSTNEHFSCIVPKEIVLKLRPNLGGLLYFGLYNMLNNNKLVRIRSFLFTRELFKTFLVDSELKVEEYFKSLQGIFYSSVGHLLKKCIKKISEVASKYFSEEALGFLWEAVRCYRTTPKSEKQFCLMIPQIWILELIIPWCKYIDLAAVGSSVINSEIFKFLMDSVFNNPHSGEELVRSCWMEIVKTPTFGADNIEVFSTVLVQICGKIDSVREITLEMAAALYEHGHDIMAPFISQFLSKDFLPWKPSKFHPSTNFVKDYVKSLYKDLGGSNLEITNEYSMTCKAAVMLISELSLQNFEPLIPHLPVILNFISIQLPTRLQENTVSTFLLLNLIEGFVCYLHSKQKIFETAHNESVAQLKKMLLLFEISVCAVEDTVSIKSTRALKISMAQFIETLLIVFNVEYPNLRRDLSTEVLGWCCESYLTADQSTRAITIYLNLMKGSVLDIQCLNSRFFDQIAALANIEIEMMEASADETILPVPPPKSPLIGRTSLSRGGALVSKSLTSFSKETWSNLGESKLQVKKSSCAILIALLNLHKEVIATAKGIDLLSSPLLFWISVSIFNLPFSSFADVYTLALENCIAYLGKLNKSVVEYGSGANSFLNCFERISNEFSGIQPLLLKSFFSKEEKKKTKDKSNVEFLSFNLLFESWMVLPEEIVDKNSVGFFYSILYGITWVLNRVSIDGSKISRIDVEVETISKQLKELLISTNEEKFADLIMALQLISENKLSVNSFDDVIFISMKNIFDIFIPDFAINISDFFVYGLNLGSDYSKVILKMNHAIWTCAKAKYGANESMEYSTILRPFKVFVKRLPFFNENFEEIKSLVNFVLSESEEVNVNAVTQIDLTSQGRTDFFPVMENSVGSAR
ncbi:hypothetical protein HK099_004606 [Clydaea vesicula]|uniref:Uncharacterized protein n=1 Tax=Clydaea vesicula TaxID=447962 RepID=A0AAD5U9R6_9FUNG|nr:hypothetical protein HK099_004606 [Clydaea vesicula]